MALPLNELQHIEISLKEWQEMNRTINTIRTFAGVEKKYNHLKCPSCGLEPGMWIPDEDNTKINCLACHHEYALCDCGEVLTEEKKSPFEPTWCVICREDWAHDNKLCPKCEKELTFVDEIGWAKGMLYCENGCIDPIPEELYGEIQAVDACSKCGKIIKEDK